MNWLRRSHKSPHASGYDSVSGKISVIIYEYPFNERIRTYLRLEHLFRRLEELVSRDAALDHHYALATIFEVMDVGARADLKSDVLKDLEKQKQLMHAYRGNPAIDQSVLDGVLQEVERCFTDLNTLSGKAGHALTENDWLMSIRSRIGIPGGNSNPATSAAAIWNGGPSRSRPWPTPSTCCSNSCATPVCHKK